MKKAEILQTGCERFRQVVESENFKTIEIQKGEFITRQSQQIKEVYWAREAQFSILHTAENGKTLSLGDYRLKDNFFGEVEFFSGHLCAFDAVATADVKLSVIPLERLTEIVVQDGMIAFWMNHRMSNMYQQSMSTAIDRSLYPLKFNVIKDIVNRFTTQSHANNHAYMYQEAQRFGCTERAYTRIIHELIDEGLVKKGSDASTIIPVDIDALKALIASYQK